MNKTQDKFSLPAVTLSIFAAAAAERLPVCSSSRALLWQEVLAAVLLMILSALASRFWQSARQSLPPGQLHFACRSG